MKNILTAPAESSDGCGFGGAPRWCVMVVTFSDDDLRRLCNTRSLLVRRFGATAVLVERRLLALSLASRLGEVPQKAPDRRRQETLLGQNVVSVCARDAGRIYFKALGLGPATSSIDEVDHIEVFAIGQGAP